MKKLFLILALLIASALFAQEGKTEVAFHGFPWGTSLTEFTARMGRPVMVDEFDGLQSLVYDNLIVSDYQAFMVAYFSDKGLEGGTYYFNTSSPEERERCYYHVQQDLLIKYGTAGTSDTILREMMPYGSTWSSDSGYVYLKIDTRRSDPVSLWLSSPELTDRLYPERNDTSINTAAGTFNKNF